MEKIPLNFLTQHPDWSNMLIIYHKLRGQGYQCFLAGGCVRDALLGKVANDLDLASDAPPEKVESLFHRTVNVGKAFRPEKVFFSTAKEDAERRDFTINALFYDLEANVVIDYVNGLVDLEKQIIRSVGNPHLRFQEDALRMLRAIRFSAVLNFQIEQETLVAMVKNRKAILKISKERITQELEKIIQGKYYFEQFQNLKNSQLITEIFPDFQYDKYDVNWLQSMTSSKQGLDLDWLMIYFLQSCSNSEAVILGIFNTWPFSHKRRQWGQFYLKVKTNPKNELSLILDKNISFLFKPIIQYLLNEFLHFKIEIELVKKLISIYDLHQGIEPKPLVQAIDLQPRFQGQELGNALKVCFQIQVLQQRTSSQEIVNEFLHRHC